MENPTPAIGKLIMRDSVLKNALAMALFPPLFQLATYFMGETISIPFLPYLLGLLSLAGILWTAYRYMAATSVFREGITIKGRVSRIDETASSRNSQGRRNYSYYAVVDYKINGEDYQSRIKLPGNPDVYGINEGGSLNLIVKEQSPKTVFIKDLCLD